MRITSMKLGERTSPKRSETLHVKISEHVCEIPLKEFKEFIKDTPEEEEYYEEGGGMSVLDTTVGDALMEFFVFKMVDNRNLKTFTAENSKAPLHEDEIELEYYCSTFDDTVEFEAGFEIGREAPF